MTEKRLAEIERCLSFGDLESKGGLILDPRELVAEIRRCHQLIAVLQYQPKEPRQVIWAE